MTETEEKPGLMNFQSINSHIYNNEAKFPAAFHFGHGSFVTATCESAPVHFASMVLRVFSLLIQADAVVSGTFIAHHFLWIPGGGCTEESNVFPLSLATSIREFHKGIA